MFVEHVVDRHSSMCIQLKSWWMIWIKKYKTASVKIKFSTQLHSELCKYTWATESVNKIQVTTLLNIIWHPI